MKTPLLRRLRLITGVILFAYVIGHLVNLSLGLWSLEVMDAARPVFMAPWQNPLGLVLLYGSLGLHMVLGFASFYRRGSLRMSSFDTMQLAMALILPPLMILHVLGTRAASVLVEFEPSYAYLMVLYWKWLPWAGLRQVLVVVVAWIHGCMGVYYLMRLQSWWPRWRGLIYPLVFVVPVAALLGFGEAGKEALVLADDPDWIEGIYTQAANLDEGTVASIYQAQTVFISIYLAILVAVVIARQWRLKRLAGEAEVQVTYVDGPMVHARAGLTLLEISRSEDVDHISICGGKGRCGTCRVRIVRGMESLPDPTPLEAETLARVQAEPDVRLACQLVPPESTLTVERIVPLDAGLEVVGKPTSALQEA